MSADKRARLKQWLETGEARLQPLTFPQRELWEASPVAPDDPANHICCLIKVGGLLTPSDCEASLQRVVERQEVLRLSILPGKERPLQMIRATGEANVRFQELSSTEASAEGVEELSEALFFEPFDMVQGPLYRARVLRRSADEHILLLAIHHSIADGWSLGVLVQDLFGAYMQGLMGLKEPLPAVPLSYSAWGAAERAYWTQGELESRAAFWKPRLAGARRLWGPTGQPQGIPARWVSEIPASLGVAARELARRSGATLFSTLLAAFQLALSKWTGADDIVVGSPVAHRHKTASHETMGYFSGIVPLRGQVDGDRPFSDALREVQQGSVDCFAHAMPFAELVHALGEKAAPGVNPVFEVRFALQNHPLPDVAMPSLSAKLRMRSSGTARFDLACEITEDGPALEVAWPYRRDRFSLDDIQTLHQIFQSVLAAACAAPGSRCRELMP
jgi:hypothetical protein